MLGVVHEAENILRSCEKVGLVGKPLTPEQHEEVREYLNSIKSSGCVWVWCKHEGQVDTCVNILREKAESSSGFLHPGCKIERVLADPHEILWQNYDPEEGVWHWLRPIVKMLFSVAFFAALFYLPLLLYVLQGLKSDGAVLRRP